MASSLVIIYLLTAVATGADHQVKKGERHALIAFICETTRERADAKLSTVLTENAWRDWIIEKSGIAGAESEKDERVQLAREHGSQITVYTDPIQDK